MSIDEIITQISNLQSPISNDEDYILYPNPNYTPITDTLPDGTLVAYDAVSRLWSTRDMRIYRKTSNGTWIKKFISVWDKFVRQENIHSRYPQVRALDKPHEAHRVTARAWLGSIPEGWEIDHIDGNNRNYNLSNLRLLPIWINHRDGGFTRRLRHNGINPSYYPRNYLLRFFKRMAVFKSTNTYPDYCNLTRKDLLRLLVNPDYLVDEHPDTAAEPNKYFDPFCERDNPDPA